ncbi:alpha/beta hydrolase-fold protein [Cognatilysobacter terrigena]|uniref:alpha/beta hydrolase-fold protein n=1 Tax=Cognatilysobacter terrigena TaxID=2488749 RepID=UPI001FEA1668|nr:alpha/beta hydrolase-fold protein [Lysobacter terrigena]
MPGCNALYVDDGQDAEAVHLAETVALLAATGEIRAPVVIAIDMPPDRMGAYGFSDREHGRAVVAPTKYGDVGARAQAYSEWLVHTLVPFVESRYAVRPSPEARAILGWSLGGAHAFNVGWQYPEVFARVGAFSPSFWLSTDRTSPDTQQRTRIAQSMVANTPPRNGARFFFAIGTDEETSDRDGDGVNDAVDDVRDLVDGWNVDAGGIKGLKQVGYRVNDDAAHHADRSDVALYVLEGGKHQQASWAQMLPPFLRWAYAVHAPPLNATGRTESWQELPSRFVVARNVDVWLPPSYGRDPKRRYPVVYMHDGQNLFDPSLSYTTGVDWNIDGAMTRLVAAHRVREAIVVGVWNTPLRFAEYMPKAPVAGGSINVGVDGIPPVDAATLRSDEYVRYLVEELKPFIDAHYRTKTGPADTFVMGSSMGGLISLYALAQRPDVFGGAGAVSTHWPAAGGVSVDWFASHLPRAGAHRIYFDHGTRTLDAQYAPFQQRVDAAMPALGYRAGRDVISRVYEGAEHNEAAWKARVDVPLQFLLGPPR